MTKADSVHSTPRTTASKINPPIDPTRRHLLIIAAGGAVAAAIPTATLMATPAVDPIFAALDAYRQADAACVAVDGDLPDEIGDRWSETYHAVLGTRPTTPAGLAALTSWVRERPDWLDANGSGLGEKQLCTLTATIDDATRGMSGLEPWSPPPPQVDAELIALGRLYEPLVDRYYVARRPWAAALVKAHAEHDGEFGDPKDRNYEYRRSWRHSRVVASVRAPAKPATRFLQSTRK
jgi:hypothetical protein